MCKNPFSCPFSQVGLSFMILFLLSGGIIDSLHIQYHPKVYWLHWSWFRTASQSSHWFYDCFNCALHLELQESSRFGKLPGSLCLNRAWSLKLIFTLKAGLGFSGKQYTVVSNPQRFPHYERGKQSDFINLGQWLFGLNE